MPLYSFMCDKCKIKTEKVVSYENRLDVTKAPKCKQCGGPTKYVPDFNGGIRIQFTGY